MTPKVHQPKNKIPAETLWAFLSVDPDGAEGIVACQVQGTMYLLLTADPDILPPMREMAKNFRKLTGKKIVVGVFRREGTDPL